MLRTERAWAPDVHGTAVRKPGWLRPCSLERNKLMYATILFSVLSLTANSNLNRYRRVLSSAILVLLHSYSSPMSSNSRLNASPWTTYLHFPNYSFHYFPGYEDKNQTGNLEETTCGHLCQSRNSKQYHYLL